MRWRTAAQSNTGVAMPGSQQWQRASRWPCRCTPAGRVALGIDLGTTNCVVAYTTQQGRVEVLTDSSGASLVPSVVSFSQASASEGTDTSENISE